MMIAAIASITIFGLSLILIFTEKIHRTIIALAGAALMVAVGIVLRFYDESKAIEAIDFNTLGLLLGMMILVSILEPTGFFQFLAVGAARISRGRPVRLLVLLGSVTTLLSMFLDNVTTVVLIAPVTILICEILGIKPVSFLISEALLANAGGVATLVGDPPNVLIASAAGLSFIDFLTHSLPFILVVWAVSLGMIRYLFRHELAMPAMNAEAVLSLNPAEAFEDRANARRVLVVLAGALVSFVFEEKLGVSNAFIALAAAAAALMWVRPPMQETLQRIEWGVLLFFAALFVMVGGLESAGVLHSVAAVVVHIQVAQPVLFAVGLLWVVASLSAVVDNVPITIALVPVIHEIGKTGIPITPLWWALAFGAGLGGNGTIIGSTASIIVASLSERTHTPITSALWTRRGFPVAVVSCILISFLFIAFYPVFTQ